MVSKIVEALKTMQDNVGLVKYPTVIVGSAIALNKLRKWNKDRKSVLKSASKKTASGVLFGKKKGKIVYSPANEEGHIAVFGGSGSGKTSAVLLPTLKSWAGTSFVIDISGDICKNVENDNKLVYEPANAHTTPYNVFGAVDILKTESERTQALEELAYLLMPENPQTAEAALFFLNEGRKILTAALIAFYSKGMDFIPICEKIVTSSWKDLFIAIDEIGNAKASAYLTSFQGNNEKTTAGCKQAVDTPLKLFALNDIVKQTLRRPRKDEVANSPECLEEQSIFVIIEDSKLELYAPLLHIITAQTLTYFSERDSEAENTILLALDEFASLGKLEITSALRKLRKKHVRIMMLTQSLADLHLIYSEKETTAMMENFSYKVVLSANDTDTQLYFAKLIGYTTVQQTSISKSGKHVTNTVNNVKDFAIEPAELAHLKENLVLLHPDGYDKLKKNFWYK